MFNKLIEKESEEELEEMKFLYVLLDMLCIKYMLDTNNPITPFEMNKAIIFNTFEEIFLRK